MRVASRSSSTAFRLRVAVTGDAAPPPRVGICSRVDRGWELGVASGSSSTGDRIYRRRVALCPEEESCPTLRVAYVTYITKTAQYQ